jgi:hypothetical protein
MAIKVKGNFNKMGKDSKKELIQFYLKGEAENAEGLQELCREIVTISVNDLPELTGEFKKIGKDSNKTVIDFVINPGATNEHKKEYYALVGKDVEVEIAGTGEDPEDFKEELKEYEKKLKAANEEQAKVDPNQVTIDQVNNGGDEQDGDDIPFTDPPADDDDELF